MSNDYTPGDLNEVAQSPVIAALAGQYELPTIGASTPLPPAPIPFPTRSGGPADRSGGTGVSRQVQRADERKAEKQRSTILKQMKELAPDIYNDESLDEDKKIEAFSQFVRFHQPITRGEVQQVMIDTLSMYDKLAGEVRRLLVTNQALLRMLVNSGIITKEEFENQARQQIEWNTTVNNIIKAYDTTPLRDLVVQVRQWNDNPAHLLKIEPHHVDLAKHLLDDEGMTLEEKLLIAEEMAMPEAFVQALRNSENERYNPPEIPAETPAPAPSDAPADDGAPSVA